MNSSNRAAESLLPTAFGDFVIRVYPDPSNSTLEHAALILGDIEGQGNVLTRIHSECLTGEVFHSLRCECREQKDLALRAIADHGSGVFIYLRQEGRGIGLENKIKAYALQDKGADTVEANHQLGLPTDARTFTMAVDILKDLNIKSVQLLTNNPTKVEALESAGIPVTQQIPLEAPPHSQNKKYLQTKKKKMGHTLKNV